MFKLNKFSTEKLFDLLKETYSKESFYWSQRRTSQSDTNDLDEDYVKPSERDEIVAYILQICEREDMNLNIETFSLFTSLLDRFLSNFNVKSKYLECLSIACLYIACKVKEEDENISVTSEFLIDCDCKYSIAELIRMEQMVLKKFEWSCNDTTAIDFLYIFYALIVNQYNSYAQQINTANQQANNMASAFSWSTENNQTTASNLLYYSTMCPPPADLDFMHTLEYKLKQCLCSNELTTTYRPHILAYSLLSIQMDKFYETSCVENRSLRDHLDKMLDLVKLNCKLSYETIDKCKEQLKHHLATIKNTKNLYNSYFNEFSMANRLKNYRPSSLFIPQLSAICTQMAPIKEEDEEEYYEDYEEMKENESDGEEQYFERKEAGSSSSSKFSTFYNEQTASNSFYDLTGQQVPSGQFLSYADILMGRAEQKRRMSESSEPEFDDNRMI